MSIRDICGNVAVLLALEMAATVLNSNFLKG